MNKQMLGCAVLLFGATMVTNSVASGHLNCPRDQAIYLEPESGTTLEFRPNEAGAATYWLMEMRLPEGLILDGAVGWGNGYSVPVGHLHVRGCKHPAGSDACAPWNALVYHLDVDGMISLVGHDIAGQQLLLPELAWDFYFWDRSRPDHIETPRSDIFVLQSCTD